MGELLIDDIFDNSLDIKKYRVVLEKSKNSVCKIRIVNRLEDNKPKKVYTY